jgi:2-deoxy-D-gluconate 3-dehydrogenase
LGQAMAIALAEAGADVAGLGSGSLEDTATRVQALGRRFLPLKVDLLKASAKDLTQVIEQVAADLGGLDILVNNAGTIRRAPVLEFSEKDWDDVMQVNLKAAFLLSQAAARLMVKRGKGKIINIASMLSFQGGIRVASYTAAKSGIAGITRLMANELASKGLNINAIAPGYMATDLTATMQADPDLMGAVVFLASAASDYMNGAIVPVDGGWLTR